MDIKWQQDVIKAKERLFKNKLDYVFYKMNKLFSKERKNKS